MPQIHYTRDRGPGRRPACGDVAGPGDVFVFAHLAREAFYREIGQPVPRDARPATRGAALRQSRAFGDGYVFGSSLAREAERHSGASQCGPCWRAWGEDRRRWKIARSETEGELKRRWALNEARKTKWSSDYGA